MKTFKEYKKYIEDEEYRKSIEENNYPNGVYISTRLCEETENLIREYQEKYLKGKDINSYLHCTLIYSKAPLKQEVKVKEYTLLGTFKGFDLFGENKDTLVIEINSEDLKLRNKELVQEYNFISDFGEYKPHITLSYNSSDIDINSLPEIDFTFKFINEEAKQLKEDWSEKDETDI